MHPTIRLANFILLIAGFAVASRFFIVLLPLLLIWLALHQHLLNLLRLLKRFRWLFLSIFVFNLWSNTTGLTWWPSGYDIWLAVERVIVLISMVTVAHLFILTTPIQDIVAGLRWWLTPLQRLKFPSDRFAIRIALILDTVQLAQSLYTETPAPQTNNPIKKISDKFSELFTTIAHQAEIAPLQQFEIKELTVPPWWQWSYPLLIGLLIWTGKS